MIDSAPQGSTRYYSMRHALCSITSASMNAADFSYAVEWIQLPYNSSLVSAELVVSNSLDSVFVSFDVERCNHLIPCKACWPRKIRAVSVG